MPALTPTDHYATVTWLGRVPHRDRPELDTIAEPELALSFAGLGGSVHSGLTRASCSRVLSQYPRGTEIRNTRQLSIISAEEIAEIAAQIGLEEMDPLWMGASIVISGIPDFSHVPPSSRLQAESGATITVDMQNRPCPFPGKTIDQEHPGVGPKFKPAANGRRGVTGWVEREGPLRIGDRLRLHIPDQRAWAG
ncbi:MOSC domain-containing protein [Alphaproteobacteria bacterium KMM 3653]|uniref:MOSC domain-containing protein n=1 Tax=Harenicola maris TaxID=2841044 RepID=A0AAP2G2I2_9RHOB|nr:MOSC domain-containing protein [Harenicola maris]